MDHNVGHCGDEEGQAQGREDQDQLPEGSHSQLTGEGIAHQQEENQVVN